MKIVRYPALGLFVILFGSLPLVAEADRYELVKGKGVEVCEAYEKNLNSFYPAIPMNCQRQISPKFKEFSKPKWHRIDVTTGVMPKIDEFVWKHYTNPVTYVPQHEWTSWRGTKEQLAEARRSYEADRQGRFLIGHLVSKVDIDNDGIQDNVYLDRACNAYGALLLVLNQRGTDVDHKKTELIERQPIRAAQGHGELRHLGKGEERAPDLMKLGIVPVSDALHHASYDVFVYRNVTYFDFWWRPRPSYKSGSPYLKYGPLRVFRAKRSNVAEVCAYKVVGGGK